MKKIIISALLLCALLVCMAGCALPENPTPTPPGENPPSENPPSENPPAEQTVYEKLDALADKTYKKVSLSIVTNTNGIELCAEYMISANNVIYSIEKLNLIDPSGDLSADFKTRLVGSAVVSGGEIKAMDGANVDLPSLEELKGSFNFSENNFENAENANNSFHADVISPSEFYGSSVNAQNMEISVEYSETALVKIVITYKTQASDVTTTYEFVS